jgi:hypothetical protein
MSQKRKLESLASLGILKDSDVKSIQAKLGKPKDYNRALTGWVGLALIEAIVILGLTLTVHTQWFLR